LIMKSHRLACRPPLLWVVVTAGMLVASALACGQDTLAPRPGKADQDKKVRQWMAALEDNDWYKRHRAAWELGDIGPAARAAVPALAKALQDPDRWVRNSAAIALGKIGKAAGGAVPALIDALKDRDRGVRDSVEQALLDVGPPTTEAVPALCALLKDRRSDLRELACTILGRSGSAAAKAVSALATTAASDPDRSVRIAAITALGDIGPAAQDAAPMLGAALKDKDQELRSAALKALRNIGPAVRGFIPVLLREAPMANASGPVLLSPDSKVVVVAARTGPGDDFWLFSGVKVWDLAAWKERAFIKEAGPLGVFSPDGGRLALVGIGDDGQPGVLVWDLKGGRKLANHKANRDEPLIPLCFSKDGQTLAMLVGRQPLNPRTDPLEVMVWDLSNGTKTSTKGKDLPGLKIVLTATGPQPMPWKDSKITLDDILAGKARVLELASTAVPHLTTLLAGGLEMFTSMDAASADGKLRAKAPAIWAGLLGGAGRGEVIVEEVKTGKEMALKAQFNGIQGIAFSPNGKTLAVYDSDQGITVWDSATGEKVAGFLDALTQTPLEWQPFTLILPGNQLLRVRGSGDDARLELWGLPLPKK
jgi:HEAT repeat protein